MFGNKNCLEVDEVRDVLTYQIWKTRARILREINNKRSQQK